MKNGVETAPAAPEQAWNDIHEQMDRNGREYRI